MQQLKLQSIRAIVTDIEGTTTDIAFVRDILFPYASQRLADFVAAHACDAPVVTALAESRTLAGRAEISNSELIDLLRQWISEDRKFTPLKTLQGFIWESGYRDGSLKAPVYADAASVLRQWHAKGKALYVYSSGSVAAQKLLFGHSTRGDLTPLFSGYFDTTVGGKLDSISYQNIASQIGVPAKNILFLSDHAGEVAAAKKAGWQAIRVERGNPLPDTADAVIHSFEQIEL